MFVCITGMQFDGCDYISEAVEKGATTIVVEKKVKLPKGVTGVYVPDTRIALGKLAATFYDNPAKDLTVIGVTTIVVEKKVKLPKGVTGVYVPDTRIALGKLAATFYDNPAKDLTVIGVTGTKGKTTVSYMIYECLKAAGYRTGLIGTIEIQTGKRRIPATRTSPESIMTQRVMREMVESGCLKAAGYRTGLIGTIEIQTGKRRIPATRTSPESIMTQRVMREMVESGCKYVVMEVSSQALKLHRVEGIVFDYAIFTNLGIDHIGNAEHVDFEEYKQCKAKLFQQCKVAILNQDDRYWEEMKRNTICKICFNNVRLRFSIKMIGIGKR